jgi:hypothetical protein
MKPPIEFQDKELAMQYCALALAQRSLKGAPIRQDMWLRCTGTIAAYYGR